MIQLKLYTKFEVSILKGCGDTFDKNLERKKKEQIQGRPYRRRPIFNPTMHLVDVNLYTKFEISILIGCGDIFHEKVLRNYGRTDRRMAGRTDGTTDRCKPAYPHFFKAGG